MPDLLDLVEPGALAAPPPRCLPRFFLLNLVGEYLLERPLRAYLDPFLLIWLIISTALIALGVGPLVPAALGVVLVIRLVGPLHRLYRTVSEDYLLLRDGLVVTAYVVGVRAYHDNIGEINGAYLDCVVPIAERRTSVGSVWLPDASEALRLNATGQVAVICLPHAPGTWRLYDNDGPGVRYEPARLQG